MKRSTWFIYIVAALAALIALPSAALAALTTQAGPFRVSVETDPAVIPVGRAKVLITITDSAGKPVEGAQVRTLVKMPTMNMGEREEVAVPEPGKPGAYSAPAAFSMAGSYEATISISATPGEATVVVPMETGQNTAGGGGFSLLSLLPWVLAAALAAFVLYRVRSTGQQINVRAIANRQVIGGVLLLVAMYAVVVYAVNNWRRPGAMTPIEAQAMEMNTPPPPGVAPVTLATVERGSVSSVVRYTGQAVGFVEQDVTPRVTGYITWMPFYAGDRVRAGQVLARLDTSQAQPQVAERQAAVNMARQEAAVSQSEYRQMLTDVNRMRAEVRGKRDALRASQGEKAAAREERASAEAELAAMQTEIADADAMVAAARADQAYWTEEIQRMKTLRERGAVSVDEYQKSVSEAAMSEAKVRQAQAKRDQATARIRAAQSMVRRAEAMIQTTDNRARQMESEVAAAEAAVATAQAAADTARRRIGQAQAGVEQARASLAGATTNRGYSEIRAQVDGVVTQRLISPGVLVNPGQAILKVAQIRPIRLQANVAESDLARIRVGSPVKVRLRDRAGKALDAKVTSIAPTIDPSARTGVVEAVVSNQDSRFVPGQYVVMEIATGKSDTSLRVPVQAVHTRTVPNREGVISTETTPYVWAAEAAPGQTGTYSVRRVDVQVGITGRDFVEIRSGLSEGQRVVLAGAQTLQSGDTVASVDEPAAVAMPTHDHGAGGATEVKVTVTNAGFDPPALSLPAGKPAKITFVRQTEQTCATSVVFPKLGITKDLPMGKPVVVEIPASQSGELAFACPMDMITGKVVVK